MSAAPDLDSIVKSARPAWLWDGDRARIVWANPAGIDYFGCETIFDLVSIPFDPADEAPARISTLTRELTGDQSFVQAFGFTDGPAIECDCTLHALPDGRDGLLVVASAQVFSGDNAPAHLMTGVLASLPIAVLVCDRSGQVVYVNAACEDLLAKEQRESLGKMLADDEAASGVLTRLETVRSATSLHQVKTRFGQRQIRLTGRPLAAGEEDNHKHLLFMAEDVTDRRVLEKSLAASAGTVVLPPLFEAQTRPQTGGKPLDKEASKAFASLSAQIDTSAKATSGQQVLPGATRDNGKSSRDKETVPGMVRDTLEQSGRAVVLHRDGDMIFATKALIDLLGHDSADEMFAQNDLAAVLRNRPEEPITVTLPAKGGKMLALTVTGGRFPWHDGTMLQATFRPAPGESAELEANAEVTGDLNEPAEADGNDPGATPVISPPSDIRSVVNLPSANFSGTEAGEPATAASSATDEVGEVSAAPIEDDNAVRNPPIAPEAQVALDTELRAILDTATDGIITLDEQGCILSFSAGAEAAFGYRLAEVAGKPIADILSKDSKATISGYMSGLREGGVASVFDSGREVTGIVSSGGELPLFVTMGKLDPEKSSGAAYCVVLRDITQWKKTENDLRRSKQEAERSSELKSEFLARISHELRTPLNAILGFSDVMRTERFGEINNEKYLSYINDIHSSGGHLLSLINDMLDLSKVEAGKQELEFTRVSLPGIIEEAIRQLQEMATQARVVLRRSIPKNTPDVVADSRSMKQIVLNLLSNAIKFTDPGGQVIMSVKTSEAGELVLSVKDTGIGMSEDELETALQPFQRVTSKEREAKPGTGLGLPLTRALTEANRARFDISSEPRKGTLVEVVFPVNRVLAE